MVTLAKLAEGTWGCDNDEINNFAIQDPLVEQIDDSTCETVFRGLAIIGIGRTALMACAGPFVYALDIRLGHHRQRRVGLVAAIAE